MVTVGLTIDKILVIMVIAMFVIGPDRLPVYAKKLGEMVRGLRRMSEGAKDRLKEEMGPEFDDVDWRQLDPRQYDPRRIIRDALLEDEQEARTAAQRAKAAEAKESRRIGGSSAAAAASTAGAAVAAGLAGSAASVGSAGTAVTRPDATDASVSGDSSPPPSLYFDEEAT